MPFLDLQIYHGGMFSAGQYFYYVGGDISFFQSINTETLTFSDLENMVKGLNSKPISKFHYRVPGESLRNGLRLCWANSLPTILEIAKTHRTYTEIYVEHEEYGTVSVSLIQELDEAILRSDDEVELIDTDHGDTDDEFVASLDHVSDDENDEIVFWRHQMLVREAKKKQGRRLSKETNQPVNDQTSNGSEGKGSQGENENENENEEGVSAVQDDGLDEYRRLTTMTDLTGFISEYDEEEDETAYGSPVYDSDEYDAGFDDPRQKKWPVFDPKTPWDAQEPAKGMLFADSNELKHCISNYSIAQGREINFTKMSKKVVLAQCKKKCGWRLCATYNQLQKRVQIKSLKAEHTCVRNFQSKLVTSKWLAREYAEDIRAKPRWKLKDFQKRILAVHKINVTLVQCYSARKYGLSEVEGVLVEHYSKLWD